MSDAPERIWIDVMAISNGTPRWRNGDWTVSKADMEGETNLPEPLEYVRADLSVAEAARVLLANERAMRFMHRPGYMPRIYDWLRALTEGGE